MFDKLTEVSLLYDFYGGLLTNRQQEVMVLYHEENYSLSEIAGEFDISRQGVHDTLKKAEKSLRSYEEKLGLVGKFESTAKTIAKIDEAIGQIIEENESDEGLCKKLVDIKKIIDRLD